MLAQSSRRDLLRLGSSAAACGTLLASANVAVATAAPALPSPGLAALFEQHRLADQVLDHFYKHEHEPAMQALRKAEDHYRAALEAIPHIEEQSGRSVAGPPVTFSSRREFSRRQAERLVDHDTAPGNDTDYNATVEAARRFVAADDLRNATIASLGPEPTEDPAWDEREKAYYAPYLAAREAIHAFPVETLADLKAKLDWIERDNGMDGEDLLPLVIADVARLAQGGLS